MNVKQLKKFLDTIPEEVEITSLTNNRSDAWGLLVKHVDLCKFVDGSGDPHLVFVPSGTHIHDHYDVMSSVGFDGTIVEKRIK